MSLFGNKKSKLNCKPTPFLLFPKLVITTNSLVIKQKGRISKRVFQESKTRMCAYQGVRNARFSENLACFSFIINEVR